MRLTDRKKNTRMMVMLFLMLLILTAVIAFDSRLSVRRYTIEAEQITGSIRIALVTDLHSCRYGEGQSELIETIAEEKPDVVFLVGDIFDDTITDTNTELFLAGIADQYPCYYVTGNHEYWSGSRNFAVKMTILEKYDVPILSGETELLNVNGETIRLCGVDDPDAYMVKMDVSIDKEAFFVKQLQEVAEASHDDEYTILLSHRPEYYETYANYDFDLVLCGHAHGGQWRIPLLLNGVYAPHQGILPRYAGGRYDAESMTMIVSRGLARETTWIPRIFNRPELVVIELE